MVISETQLALVCGDVPIEDLAYIAGLFDGEGSIYMIVKGARCRVELQITNLDKSVLDWVQSRIGGIVYYRHRKTDSPDIKSYQIVYDLRIWTRLGVKRALLALLPHLKIKKERVKYALLLLNNLRPKQRNALPKEYWQRLQAIIDEANIQAPPGRPQYLENYNCFPPEVGRHKVKIRDIN